MIEVALTTNVVYRFTANRGSYELRMGTRYMFNTIHTDVSGAWARLKREYGIWTWRECDKSELLTEYREKYGPKPPTMPAVIRWAQLLPHAQLTGRLVQALQSWYMTVLENRYRPDNAGYLQAQDEWREYISKQNEL